jgi:hypothetical protein
MSAWRKKPGSWNAGSMRTAFVTIRAMLTDTSPSTGGSAARRAWRRMTRFSVMPLARAVRMKSSSSASAIDARVMRWHIAASGAASTSHGTHSDCSQRSGSSPNGT